MLRLPIPNDINRAELGTFGWGRASPKRAETWSLTVAEFGTIPRQRALPAGEASAAITTKPKLDMTRDTITLWNTGLPLGIAGALGWFMPRFIAPSDTRSHKKVAIAMAASAIVLILVFAGLFAVFQSSNFVRTAETGDLFLAIEIAIRGSLLFAVVWVPIMLMCWLNIVQRFEAWRGKGMAERES